jgi:nitrite reductase/ring-hydroxylating ferredoxin subunit
MSDRIEVAEVSSFPAGESRIVETDGQISIGVFNVDGEYHALLNKCLHQNGPLCEGAVEPELVAEWPGPGHRVTEEYGTEFVVKCPWHGWEYDLESGRLLRDEDIQVPVFETTVDDGTLYIELS